MKSKIPIRGKATRRLIFLWDLADTHKARYSQAFVIFRLNKLYFWQNNRKRSIPSSIPQNIAIQSPEPRRFLAHFSLLLSCVSWLWGSHRPTVSSFPLLLLLLPLLLDVRWRSSVQERAHPQQKALFSVRRTQSLPVHDNHHLIFCPPSNNFWASIDVKRRW